MAIRNRIVISGSIGTGGLEEWSTGITYAGLGSGNLQSPEALQDWAEDAFALVTDGVTNPRLLGMLSTAATVDAVTAYYYPEGGPATGVGASSASPVAGTSTIQQTPQTSVVMSMLTGMAGRSRRGRCYWPALGGVVLGTTLGISASIAQDLADEWAVLISAIADAGGGLDPFFPGVYSPTLDLITPVSQVAVGNVLDTQRRRRDGLAEQYSTADVA